MPAAAHDWLTASRELAGKLVGKISGAAGVAAAGAAATGAAAPPASHGGGCGGNSQPLLHALLPDRLFSSSASSLYAVPNWVAIALAATLAYELLLPTRDADITADLVLGERGAAGLVWAALSPLSALGGVVAAVLEASGLLRAGRLLGRRGAVGRRVREAVGEKVDVARRPPTTWKETDVVGVCGWVKEEVGCLEVTSVRRDSLAAEADVIKTQRRRKQLTILHQERVASFDSFTRTLLSRTAVCAADSPIVPQRLWIPTPSSHWVRRRQTRQDRLWLAMSFVKLAETSVLCWYYHGQPTPYVFILAAASAAPWLFFLAASLVLELMGLSREGIRADIDDDVTHVSLDLLQADRLPSFDCPGGDRRVLLAVPMPVRATRAWALTWLGGALVCVISQVACWASLLLLSMHAGSGANGVLVVWLLFAAVLAALRAMYFRVAAPMDGPARHDEVIGAAGNEVTLRDAETKLRLLGMTTAVGHAMTQTSPRGAYCYTQDCFDAGEITAIFNRCEYVASPMTVSNAAAAFSFPEAITSETETIEVRAVMGDTLLASLAWMHGLKHSPYALYDCALLVIRATAGSKAEFIIPCVRVLASSPSSDSSPLAAEQEKGGNFVPKGVGNDGTEIGWTFWVPLGEDRWLYLAPAMNILGTRQANVLDDAGVTEQLQAGKLFISLESVEQVKDIIALSASIGSYMMA